MAKKVEKETSKLQEALDKLEKKYGSGAIIHGNEKGRTHEVVSTGSLGLDIALGINGLPKGEGKIVEIYGWESCGKSTLAQTIIGNFQKDGVKCLLIDAEDSLDEDYARNLGINLEELYVIQLDEHGGEGAYNKMETLVETGEIGLVVIDSYNALQPLKIVNGEVGDATIGLHARMLNQAVMKCNNLASKHGVLFIFLGQLREKIGVLWGSPETTQGGNALRFYSHVRLKVTRSTTTDNSRMEGDVKIGNKTTVKVEKNKLSLPFKSCSFDILYGKGIDKTKELIELASEYEVIKKWGKTITFEEKKIEEEEFYKFLENIEFFNKIKEQVIEKIKNSDIKVKEE